MFSIPAAHFILGGHQVGQDVCERIAQAGKSACLQIIPCTVPCKLGSFLQPFNCTAKKSICVGLQADCQVLVALDSHLAFSHLLKEMIVTSLVET